MGNYVPSISFWPSETLWISVPVGSSSDVLPIPQQDIVSTKDALPIKPQESKTNRILKFWRKYRLSLT